MKFVQSREHPEFLSKAVFSPRLESANSRPSALMEARSFVERMPPRILNRRLAHCTVALANTFLS
jgi:hypothetical protein